MKIGSPIVLKECGEEAREKHCISSKLIRLLFIYTILRHDLTHLGRGLLSLKGELAQSCVAFQS
jgi:hypothetical protein